MLNAVKFLLSSGKKMFFFLIFLLILNCTLNIDNCLCQWGVQTFPFNGVVYGIAFKDVNNGVACGHNNSASEMLYFTTNSGTNWILASYPATLRVLPSVQYINATTLYAGGAENNVLLSRQEKYDSGFAKLPYYIKNHFLYLGVNGLFGEYKEAFIKSTNSGLNWTKVSNFDTSSGYLMDIQFFNESTGYACADSGNYGNSRILKTTNGGINWQKYYLEPQIILYNIFFIDANTGFACGYSAVTSPGGFIYKTTNAGMNWTKKSFPYPGQNEVKDICFFNSTTGIAINSCEVGILKSFKSTNTGVTWDSVTAFGNIIPESVNFINGTGTALITGYIDSSMQFANYTFKTTDYGSTWVRKKINVNNTMIFKSSLVDQNNWFIGGGDVSSPAVVLKSTNGGGVFVSQISNTIPEKFELFQNYPNPFNPTTKIKFDIPKRSPIGTFGDDKVVLKIFDLAGREVATLVNEKFSPGKYEVTFDGSTHASGVYFYRLNTNEFSETKRMLLVK
jgi:photosystem II stability/assembly factor-like uncharacterized protein